MVSVALTDGVEKVRAGDALDYVATVTNDGGTPAAVTVTVSTPAYLTLDGEATWAVELAGGESREFTVSGTVGEPPAEEYQVVATASVAPTDAPDTVLVRAVDADGIPGADAPVPVAGLAGEQPAPADATPWVVGAGALLAAAAAAAAFWISRRRSARS